MNKEVEDKNNLSEEDVEKLAEKEYPLTELNGTLPKWYLKFNERDKKNFIKGYRAKEAALQSGSGVWVKASERLPDKKFKGEWFNLKLKGYPAVGKFIKGVDVNEYYFDIEKYGTNPTHTNLEWLDESKLLPNEQNVQETI